MAPYAEAEEPEVTEPKQKTFFPDIQTGRNVYIDSKKYSTNDAYKAKVDSDIHEGFMSVVDGVPEAIVLTPENPEAIADTPEL